MYLKIISISLDIIYMNRIVKMVNIQVISVYESISFVCNIIHSTFYLKKKIPQK